MVYRRKGFTGNICRFCRSKLEGVFEQFVEVNFYAVAVIKVEQIQIKVTNQNYIFI